MLSGGESGRGSTTPSKGTKSSVGLSGKKSSVKVKCQFFLLRLCHIFRVKATSSHPFAQGRDDAHKRTPLFMVISFFDACHQWPSSFWLTDTAPGTRVERSWGHRHGHEQMSTRRALPLAHNHCFALGREQNHCDAPALALSERICRCCGFRNVPDISIMCASIRNM